MPNEKNILPKVWKDINNDVISCSEKIKLLNENIIEIKRMSDDAIEDAILMGADPNQFIDTLIISLKKIIYQNQNTQQPSSDSFSSHNLPRGGRQGATSRHGTPDVGPFEPGAPGGVVPGVAGQHVESDGVASAPWEGTFVE